MPQEIRIHDYHGELHIHPPRGTGRRIPIRPRSMDEVKEILVRHIRRRQGVVFQELVGELR